MQTRIRSISDHETIPSLRCAYPWHYTPCCWGVRSRPSPRTAARPCHRLTSRGLKPRTCRQALTRPRPRLGTGFTYQGNLKKNGQPVTATCSFSSACGMRSSGGSQKGTTQIANNAAVQAGVFTVRLDFSNQFTGEARWLQTALQYAGDGGYITLAPRQPLNAVPYAIGLMPAPQSNSLRPTAAPFGRATNTNSIGVVGEGAGGAGVWGQSSGASGTVGISAGQYAGGVYGENTGKGYGVWGKAPNSAGVAGESTAWIASTARAPTRPAWWARAPTTTACGARPQPPIASASRAWPLGRRDGRARRERVVGGRVG